VRKTLPAAFSILPGVKVRRAFSPRQALEKIK
jgi:hypothetical protein